MSPGQPHMQAGKSNLRENSTKPKKLQVSGFDHRVTAGSRGLSCTELACFLTHRVDFIKLVDSIAQNRWGSGTHDTK